MTEISVVFTIVIPGSLDPDMHFGLEVKWLNYPDDRRSHQKAIAIILKTVESAMSSHSYEQPTSYGRPLGHSPKWHSVYKCTSYEHLH